MKITTLPRVYSFSFNTETLTLFFSVQKWAIDYIQRAILADNNTFMDSLYQQYGGDKKLFYSFGKSKVRYFGWNNVMKHRREYSEEIIYSYQIASPIDWSKGIKDHTLSQVLHSLYPILLYANGFLKNWDEDKLIRSIWRSPARKQTIALEYSETKELNNPFQVWTSEKTNQAISSLSDSEASLVNLAMIKTCQKLTGEDNLYDFHFTQKFAIDDFSQGLIGMNFNRKDGSHRSIKLSTQLSGEKMFNISNDHHFNAKNISSDLDKFLLLVGLAKLNDLAETKFRQK